MVLKRMRDLVMANIHEGLDNMEKPHVMLNQYLRDMEAEMAKAKQSVIKQQTLEKSFERQMNGAKQLAEKRKKQAELAFDAGEETLARRALIEKRQAEAKVKHYEGLHQQAEKQVQDLKEQLSTLEEKFQALKDKKHALIARANAARAKEHMNASISKTNSESTYKEFQRLEGRIVEMEIKANAWANTDGFESDQLTNLEYADEVEKELEDMRAKKKEVAAAEEKTKSNKQNEVSK